eukprot:m.47507 g.47507  ORF g.47507 m.47507 type:complete len:92 (-) comp8868_c0_seq1:301-576(-)
MHDTVTLESLGVPTVGLYSSAFRSQAAFQAEKRGLTAAARAFVPHPISDQTKEQLTAKATAVFDEVVLALTDPTFTNAAVEDDANEDDAGP